MNFRNTFKEASQILIICFLSSLKVFGQNEPSKDSVKTYRIEEVVVTATRAPIEKEKAPQNIDVITNRDLKLTEGQEFTDLLKKNSSINIVQYPGLLSGVGIRGFRPQVSGLNQRVLLLVDGRPAGTTVASTINPANIERVEVLKGPASALYGSQAMGGVINIITKKSTGKINSKVFAEYGSYQTFKLGGTSGGNITPKLDFDLSFNFYDRNRDFKIGEGNIFRDMLAANNAEKFYFDGTTKKEADKRGDGSRRDHTKLTYGTGSIRLGYQISKDLRVDVKGEKFTANDVESPGDITFGNLYPGLKDLDRNSGEVLVSGKVKDHSLSFRVYGANEITGYKTILEAPAAPYLSFKSITEWVGFQLKDIYQIGEQTFILGIDHNNATSKSRAYSDASTETAPYSPNYSYISSGIYLQAQLKFFEKLFINVGERVDIITYNVKKTPLLDNYKSGKETNPFYSPSLGVQFEALRSLRAHATIGRAFVTPEAFHVAGYSVFVSPDGAAVSKGNPDLKNESSWTWDAGVRFNNAASGISADVTYFSTQVKNRITSKTTVPSMVEKTENGDTIRSYTSYINANETEIRGLEFEVGYDLGALTNYKYSLRLYANATSTLKATEITISENKTTETDIYNVPGFTTSFGIDYNSFKGLNLRLSGRYVGKRKDLDFNDPGYPEIRYPDFMVTDFSASYTYVKKHTLTLFVNNLTDENYYEKRGFNMPGRNYSVQYALNF